jgi:dCMP deaminase
MNIAVAASERSTCPRAAVGAIVAREKHVISTGYNGSPSGEPHCEDIGCAIVEGRCVRTVHAEINAIMRAGFTVSCSLYTTHLPCFECSKIIINSGIISVYYAYEYEDVRQRVVGYDSLQEYLRQNKVHVIKL